MPSRRDFLYNSIIASAAFAQAGKPTPAASSKKIRIGVAGGGFGSTFHWHEHPQCVVAAVTDLYPERRRRLRDAYHCDYVFNSLEEMLQRAQNLDAVAVFTGAPDHFKHVQMCFQRGLHVVSAVPACMTLEEAQQLKELKEKTGLHYMMAESSYYRPACIYARNLYRQGGFGNIFYGELEYYHDMDVEGWLKDKKSLFYHPDSSISWRQGMPPMLYPTHSLGFLTGVTGERITRVSCLGWGDPRLIAKFEHRPHHGNPYFNEVAVMETNGGHMTRCNVCWQIAAEGEQARWFGEKGSLYMSLAGLNPDTWTPRGQKPRPIQFPEYWKSDMLPQAMRHESGHGGSAVFISAEFINALIDNREPAIDVYESLAMTVPGIVAHQSALKHGEQMKVPQFDKSA